MLCELIPVHSNRYRVWGKRGAQKLVLYLKLNTTAPRYSKYPEDYWPCAGGLSSAVTTAICTQLRYIHWAYPSGLSAVIVIGTQILLRHPINIELWSTRPRVVLLVLGQVFVSSLLTCPLLLLATLSNVLRLLYFQVNDGLWYTLWIVFKTCEWWSSFCPLTLSTLPQDSILLYTSYSILYTTILYIFYTLYSIYSILYTLYSLYSILYTLYLYYYTTILYTLYSILYTLYSILYTLYSILYTLYSILYTLYSILYTLYSILYTLYSKLYTIYSMLYTLYSILYTLYSILYTLYYYTLYSITIYYILYALYSILYTLYSILYTLYSILYTLYSILYNTLLYLWLILLQLLILLLLLILLILLLLIVTPVPVMYILSWVMDKRGYTHPFFRQIGGW